MVTPAIKYECDICHATFDHEEPAIDCEAIGVLALIPDPQIGQIVSCGSFGGWHGDPEWFEAQAGGTIAVVHPKYVVVDRRPRKGTGRQGHMIDYILWSPSHRDGNPRRCWTSIDHIGIGKMFGMVEPMKLAQYQAEADAWEWGDQPA